MTLVELSQIAGILVCLTGVSSIFVRQGKHVQKTDDLDDRIKQLEEEDFITESSHDLMQNVCRTEIFSDINQCQSDLKSDIREMKSEVNSVMSHMAEMKVDIKNTCSVVNEIKEAVLVLKVQQERING